MQEGYFHIDFPKKMFYLAYFGCNILSGGTTILALLPGLLPIQKNHFEW